ncbi:hypothetical protein RFI_23580 [Reticulomyxa filosa]|uniref:Uncharacterized protein n=1 Tax=Reticulomyxa filosa TaxID=46433 RepID=X6MIF2_RETFI|nr:hypothetical protein RFI_23580 [Reticulomyxa filosa]|eukprot:ETO13788.1 hypothetical protein RFI_23580 [Reticulomyxa filosa]
MKKMLESLALRGHHKEGTQNVGPLKKVHVTCTNLHLRDCVDSILDLIMSTPFRRNAKMEEFSLAFHAIDEPSIEKILRAFICCPQPNLCHFGLVALTTMLESANYSLVSVAKFVALHPQLTNLSLNCFESIANYGRWGDLIRALANLPCLYHLSIGQLSCDNDLIVNSLIQLLEQNTNFIAINLRLLLNSFFSNQSGVLENIKKMVFFFMKSQDYLQSQIHSLRENLELIHRMPDSMIEEIISYAYNRGQAELILTNVLTEYIIDIELQFVKLKELKYRKCADVNRELLLTVHPGDSIGGFGVTLDDYTPGQ